MVSFKGHQKILENLAARYENGSTEMRVSKNCENFLRSQAWCEAGFRIRQVL
jgi:hypothetical protein